MVYIYMQPTVTDSNLKGGRAHGPRPPNPIWLWDTRPDSLIGKKVNNSGGKGGGGGVGAGCRVERERMEGNDRKLQKKI